MAYIPKDAEWYLADLVNEISVEGEVNSIIHINTVLVHASSPTEAYERAMELGFDQVENSYLNPAGKMVATRFVGVKELTVIYDRLEHGAELFFEEIVGATSNQAVKMIPPKENLSVFSPVEPSKGPDYSSGCIGEDYLKSCGE